MNSRLFIIFVLAIFVSALLAGCLQPTVNLDSFKYKIDYEGIVFVSNDQSTSDFLKAFSQLNQFIVSPILAENQVSDITPSLVLTQTVLSGNGKFSTVLIQVMENNSLKYCQTNDGNVLANNELTIDDCQFRLSEDFPQIIIRAPNENLPKPYVLLQGKKIEIFGRNAIEVERGTYYTMLGLFANTPDLIAAVNGGLNQS